MSYISRCNVTLSTRFASTAVRAAHKESAVLYLKFIYVQITLPTKKNQV